MSSRDLIQSSSKSVSLQDVRDADSSAGGLTLPAKPIRRKSNDRLIGMKDAADKKNSKVVIVMVGLPGRGKTYVARKVARYLRWIDKATMVFSLAKYRLEEMGPQRSDFFNPHNAECYQKRVKTMLNALEDLLSYLNRDGDVGIIDGTNTSFDRRRKIIERVKEEKGCSLLWIEMISERRESLDTWINENTSSSSTTTTAYSSTSNDHSNGSSAVPEYEDKIEREKRLKYYRQDYSQVSEEEGSFIKMVDNGRKLELHQIHGLLPTKIAAFVLNLHTLPRPIFIVRAGESENNTRGLIGGDSSLSPRGQQFAAALSNHLSSPESGVDCSKLQVWSSCLARALDTAALIPCERLTPWQALREIELGVCDGKSQEEIRTLYPEECQAYQQDTLRYRYPRAENYLDVIARLEPLIFELEQQRQPICVVAHQAVLRCLYAYFLDVPQQEIPYLSMPLHTITRLDPRAYACHEKRVKILLPLDG
eukprot:CAMPEP_0182425376 /NCGR_PEP_ID=MMETSP1167-20130531/11777_1 /TAXON_ID=2988 /ORGANISM="Mallomonas Sp, Strain CCMP3275" /LENGTH=478 /DNA_ID=CAMNT_0024606051 /DNA_START=210 /DNA_END=1646 /DNA_ORIENTATION=+